LDQSSRCSEGDRGEKGRRGPVGAEGKKKRKLGSWRKGSCNKGALGGVEKKRGEKNEEY